MLVAVVPCVLAVLASIALMSPAVALPPELYDDDGWPRGLTIVQMRRLRACQPDEALPTTPGAYLPCRPPLVTHGPQWSLAADWTTGGTFGDVPTIGGVHGLGIDLDLALLRNVQLGGRYELLAIRL